jgi:hypothetical protein
VVRANQESILDALLFTVHIGDRVVLSDAKLTLDVREGMAGRKQELTLVPHRQALAFCPTHQSPTRGH